MFTGTYRDFNQAYPAMIKAVMEQGAVLPSRVAPTREIHPAMVEVLEPRKRLVTAYERPVNVAFALAEVLWILQGRADVEMLSFYNGTISNYSDDGVVFNAAYGWRLRREFDVDQLVQVERLLTEDPESRQATLVMSSPYRDRAYTPIEGAEFVSAPKHHTKDRACNVLAHLMVRDGALDWVQIVRSNDAMWGTPYNWMQFTHLQEYIATRIGVPVGKYTHVVDSLHVYDYHWEQAANIAGFDLYEEMMVEHPEMHNCSDKVMSAVYDYEERIRNDQTRDLPLSVPEYWVGALKVLEAHRSYKEDQNGAALTALLDSDSIYGAAQARFYYYNRWHKDDYKDIVNELSDTYPDRVFEWIVSSVKEPAAT